MFKKILALLLVLAMLLGLCACGNGGTNTANVNNETNTNTEPAPEPEPEPEPPKIYDPLTGLEVEEDVSSLRPICIMMNNISYAMPQHGNSDASVLIEMNVEGSITRMFGVFSRITSKNSKIGSIRSARPYYLDWVLAFDGVYMSVGGSGTAMNNIQKRGVTHINGNVNTEIYYRDQDRKAAGYAYEHTMFTTGQKFEDGYAKLDIRKEHEGAYDYGLRFTDTAQTSAGTAATAVTVNMNSKKTTLFDYDSASGNYLISEHSDKFVDGNTGKQVEVKNVLALYVKYRHEYSGSTTLLADMTGGKGVYMCEGKMIDIEWSLAEGKGLTLKKADGTALELMPGHTFICCPDASSGKVDAH